MVLTIQMRMFNDVTSGQRLLQIGVTLIITDRGRFIINWVCYKSGQLLQIGAQHRE